MSTVTSHFAMGAINRTTGQYEYTTIAAKTNKYDCPDCARQVIFKKGPVKRPHFAHKASNDPCTYYTKPSETQIHKDAKLVAKTLFDTKRLFCIAMTCTRCYSKTFHDTCGTEAFYQQEESSVALVEYKFSYNGSDQRSADVAIVGSDGTIRWIFEICHRNPTQECNRSGEWFEFDAETLIAVANETNVDDVIQLRDLRKRTCAECCQKEEARLVAWQAYEASQKEANEQARERTMMDQEDTLPPNPLSIFYQGTSCLLPALQRRYGENFRPFLRHVMQEYDRDDAREQLLAFEMEQREEEKDQRTLEFQQTLQIQRRNANKRGWKHCDPSLVTFVGRKRPQVPAMGFS